MIKPVLWLPNLLTSCRLVLIPPIVLTGLDGNWAICFWLVIIALTTDFLDGWAAKAFQAQTRLGEHLDPLADFSLAAAGVSIMVFTDHLPLWVGLLLLVPALYVGYVKFLSKDDKIRIIQPLFSVPYLFIIWISTVLFLARQAYGWFWWYLAAAGLLLLAAAYFKQHRLRQWFAWLLERQRTSGRG